MMSKNKNDSLDFSRDKYFAAASLIYLHGKQWKTRTRGYSYKYRIWSHCYFNKEYLFHQHMIDFGEQTIVQRPKNQTNGTVGDESYKGKFLFTMIDFVPFGTYFW